MALAVEEFHHHVRAILQRYCAQNGVEGLDETELMAVGARLWDVILRRGLPTPLAAGEVGSPGEMSAAEVSPLVDAVVGTVARRVELLDPVRQLVKACFYREFTICRDSYREVGPEGGCRRQQLKKARSRISGSHCVDCPYWTACDATQHAELLLAAWVGDAAEFARNRAVYLPEDFRALRVWLHAAARHGWIQNAE